MLLVLLGTIAWHNRKDKQWLPVVYCVFLILYITLLRRAPGYNESIRLRLKLWPNAGVWAGNLLNLILYVPYGVTSWQWKREGKKIVVAGFALSVFCEVLQYLTGRGMADVNDVLFNTLGAAVGMVGQENSLVVTVVVILLIFIVLWFYAIPSDEFFCGGRTG